MKRLAVVLAAGVAAVGLYAVTAPAGPEAVSPRRVAALERKVTTLQREMRQAKAQLACTSRALGLTQFGDPNASFGYAYRAADGTSFFTTALDATEQGQRPSVNLAIVNESCIGSAFERVQARTAPKPAP
jgi:hypothetical protein